MLEIEIVELLLVSLYFFSSGMIIMFVFCKGMLDRAKSYRRMAELDREVISSILEEIRKCN